MSINSVSSDSSAVKDLSRTLMRDHDVNQDGQFSSEEFASFLNGLIRSLVGGQFGNTELGKGLSTASAPMLTSLEGTESDSSSSTTGAGDGTSPGTKTTVTSPTAFRDRMLGFDYSRFESAKGSIKYDAANIMQGIDPNDPDAMKKVYEQMIKIHPGEVSLDKDGNLMLDSTADGYIGVRPLNRDEDWNNPPSGRVWQWHAYNAAHPGPNGEGLG